VSINQISAVWAAYNILKAKKKTSSATAEAYTKPAWRPTQWDGLTSVKSQLILIKTNIGGYFFDAVFREEHTSTLKITEHPIQSGSNIVDHAYMEPRRLVMDIGMSDAMDTLYDSQWSGAYTKSVSAYRILLALQTARTTVSVHTRLYDYTNMLIESITAPDDYSTQLGLKCTVTLRELMVVEVDTNSTSTDTQTTDSTNSGTVATTTLSDTETSTVTTTATGSS